MKKMKQDERLARVCVGRWTFLDRVKVKFMVIWPPIAHDVTTRRMAELRETRGYLGLGRPWDQNLAPGMSLFSPLCFHTFPDINCPRPTLTGSFSEKKPP